MKTMPEHYTEQSRTIAFAQALEQQERTAQIIDIRRYLGTRPDDDAPRAA